MPVALKLSKRFYDTFGQEATDELVDALNAVDQSYRSEFRELFDAHFGRLESQMRELLAEHKLAVAENMRQQELRLAALEGRMAAFQEKTAGDLKGMKSELIGWMVGLWFVSVALSLLTRAFAG